VRPIRNVFYKLSCTEQRREGVAAYLWARTSKNWKYKVRSNLYYSLILSDRIGGGGGYFTWSNYLYLPSRRHGGEGWVKLLECASTIENYVRKLYAIMEKIYFF
jgi:hypothetical protein